MIQKKMIGRLGNQLFQYATLRAYMIEHNIIDEVLLNFDLCRNSVGDGFDDSLKLFNTYPYKETPKIHYTISQMPVVFFIKSIEKIIKVFSKKKNIEYRIYGFEKKFQKLFNCFGLFWVTNGYIKFGSAKFNKDNLVFYGFFESPKYFDHIKETLRDELTIKEVLDDKIVNLRNKLQENKKSVCVSIRRGDFLTNEKFKKLHYICDENYFYRAIDLMKEKIKDCTFFVCSDDVDWCKENMDWPESTIFEEKNNTLVEKVAIMSGCNNFIVSNSTFSWWVQYLSLNDKKVVVAPGVWRKKDYTNGKIKNDIYEDNWLLI